MTAVLGHLLAVVRKGLAQPWGHDLAAAREAMPRLESEVAALSHEARMARADEITRRTTVPGER